MSLTHEEIKKIKGLSQKEVEDRLKQDGYNELPSTKKKNIFGIVLEVIKEPMFILLLICGTLYLILGDISEACMLLGFVFVIMGITIYQENKTEKALQALKDLSSPTALVIRDGIEQKISSRDLVKDDIVIIREGDKISADCILISSRNICVDESLLTGESVPVRKATSDEPDYTHFRPGGDDLPFLFSGTLVVSGSGIAKVLCTGINTEIGHIGKALGDIQSEGTILQKEVKKIVKMAFIIAIILCLSVFLIYSISRGDWIHGLLAGLTLAMGILPEEFPVVLTIFLALGAWRMSKKHVLTRKMNAVETLGSCTVLCTDKTGTLTQNKMTVKKLFCSSGFYDISNTNDKNIPEGFHELIEYGILASEKDPFDPMEKSLKIVGSQIDSAHTHDFVLQQDYPLSKELLALSHVWKDEFQSDSFVVASKGAPEAIMDLCHLDQKQKSEIEKNIEKMASEGLRILGVAKASFQGKNLPTSQHDFIFEFIGLIGWIDPIRTAVPQAIKECYEAGIKVIMITGDYPTTAQNIAKQIGLKNPENIITGIELRQLPESELLERMGKTNIIARVVPEEKLIIVDLLKKNGYFVAMTGDGVNDAPALKSAHIGIAMGERGTDVARESSAIVLLDDDFSSIVHGVRMGRRIFDNLKKAMIYIVSVHVPIAGASLVPILFGRPIILFPVHVVFLELLIDPACSVLFEAEKEESNIMKRKPRSASEPLFGRRTLFLSVIQGLISFAFVIAIFKILLMLGQSESIARTSAFVTLIISNLGLILVNRSWTRSMISMFRVKNPALPRVCLGALAFLALVVYLPFFQGIFRFSALSTSQLLVALGSGVMSVFRFEGVKMFFKKRNIELLKN